MATFITIWGLKTSKHATNQYIIINIYMPANDIQEQKIITHIWHEIYLLKKLKANMLVSINIIMPKQFDFNLNRKTAYIKSYSYLFNLDIKISYAFI